MFRECRPSALERTPPTRLLRTALGFMLKVVLAAFGDARCRSARTRAVDMGARNGS
jgi:hypothetical protein